jgi:ribosomal protein S18 acetylase RimI-like enzyme
MRETTLATLNHAEFAAAFNTVYQDYLVPFVVDASWAGQHIAANDIVPEHSPLWLDDAGKVVALAVLGRRGARGWVGGFGVAPDYRGRGLAARLIDALLQSARGLGMGEVRLEVIAGNTRAIRTYERAGFLRTRDLRILARPDDAPAPEAGERAVPATPGQLLPHGPRLRPVRPAWQRESASLAHGADLSGLALGTADAPTAYLLYRANAQNAIISDFAVPTVEAALALAAALQSHLPGRTLRIANEPEESPACAALDRLGWRETLRQHEMVRAL